MESSTSKLFYNEGSFLPSWSEQRRNSPMKCDALPAQNTAENRFELATLYLLCSGADKGWKGISSFSGKTGEVHLPAGE